MNTKSFFPYGGGSNLILGIHRENQMSFLKTPAIVKFFFTKMSRNDIFGVNKKSLPTQMHLYNLYRVPHTIP